MPTADGGWARLLRRAVGWPARRLLDERVRWGISLLDDRLGRRPVQVHDRLDDLDRLGRAQLQALGFEHVRGGRGRAPLAQLDAPTAAFANWLGSPEGYAAQAGVWFNPPVPVDHRPGEVGILLVNERIVEQPFVFAQVGPPAPPLRVLDLGGAESTVALSLAVWGHDVTVVDPRGYPVAHPSLTVAPVAAERLAHAGAPFDVVVALSAVEHFGLDAYGPAGGDAERADRAALAHALGLTRPGGRLVLTVPIGATASVDELQRRYDEAGVRELLGPWLIDELRCVWRRDRLTWTPGTFADATDEGVALVTARAPTPPLAPA